MITMDKEMAIQRGIEHLDKIKNLIVMLREDLESREDFKIQSASIAITVICTWLANEEGFNKTCNQVHEQIQEYLNQQTRH